MYSNGLDRLYGWRERWQGLPVKVQLYYAESHRIWREAFVGFVGEFSGSRYMDTPASRVSR